MSAGTATVVDQDNTKPNAVEPSALLKAILTMIRSTSAAGTPLNWRF